MSIDLNDTIGSSYPADPGDVLNVKTSMNNLGYYDPPAAYGLTPWPDTPMFDGIKNFQKDHDLEVDGIMHPDGPTVTTMNKGLAQGEDSPSDGNEQLAYNPAAANLLDMMLQRGTKGGGGGNSCPGDRAPRSGDECDELYNADSSICRSLPPVPRIRRNCWSSASERNAACRSGRPLPPLDSSDRP
ncbi:peptidoglycan-binding domain-containing protein [Paramagnetospirillum magneticum]|uniref:Peptidoglycan binding-like domain-containing protein n=1 Tax=Paramagnetospirillum magneticum (strain ATCC 700264 / AMB-1) TaxID=342108 RepID=Q2VZY9_PARM1|nr:peptidoglycan-binding domain-containing protein [Paramagnetospirillum magneticum]BAE52836.1 hypothetical protein amb4032 [Paramagnetospirillum magneticum AMB-1]